MEQVKTRKQSGIAITLALAMLLASLGTSIANIALPALAEVFASSFAQIQAVVVAYLATLTATVVIAGRLGDRYGLKPALLTGFGLFALASLACSLAPDLWWLIGARAVQGIGAAFLMTLSMALMRQTADDARIGRAMGLLGTISALGTALGPSLGGLLLAATGWRGIFLVQFLPAVVGLVLALATLPDDTGQKRTSRPSLRCVLDAALVPGLVVNMLVAVVMMTTLVVGPFYLGSGLGLKASLAGLIMAIGPVIAIFAGAPSGRLVDAWGGQRVLMIGLSLVAAGAFLLALLPGMIGTAGYVLAIAVLTPGYQLFQAANNTVVMADIAGDRRGTVSGLLGLSRNIGLILGASLMGAVFAASVGTDTFADVDPVAIGRGMRLTFLLAGAIVIAAIGIVMLARRAERRARLAEQERQTSGIADVRGM